MKKYNYFKNLVEEDVSLKFRLKNIEETKNYLIEKTNRNEINYISAMDNNKWKDNFKNLKILKAKLFVSIHIFKAMLQVKNSFKKRYITIKVKKC